MSVAARLPALLLLALALIAAWSSTRDAAGWLGTTAALPVLFGGAAFPWLVRRAPDESSALKLALFAALLSPALFAAAFVGFTLFASPSTALTTVFCLIAATQLVVGDRRVSTRPPARAELAAVALGMLLAGGLLALHFDLPELRLFGDGGWHAGRAGAIARGALDENPWMAGTSSGAFSGYEALLASVARALDVDPSFALVITSTWATLLLPIALYFLAAPLWNEPRRVLAVCVLTLGGWNAAAGLVWLAQGRPPLTLFGGDALQGAGLVVSPLALGWLCGALVGPALPALVLALGGWVAAGHALRHARAPWVGLCGVSHGLALLVDPSVGFVALAVTAAVALLAPGSPIARPAVLLALALGALPGLARLSAGPTPGPYALRVDPLTPAHGLAGIAMLALAGALLLGRRAQPGPVPPRGVLLALALAGVALAVPVASYVARSGAGVLLGGVAAALLAAGGLARVAQGGLRRVAGLALAIGIGLGGLAQLARGSLAIRRLRDVEPALEVSALCLAPLPRAARDHALSTYEALMQRAGVRIPTSMAIDADDRAGYDYLRELSARGGRRPALILSDAREAQRPPIAPWVHPAPLFSGLSLWVDRSEPCAHALPSCEPRVRLARELFAGDPAAAAAITRELERLGLGAVVWVGSAERQQQRGLDGALARAGFEVVFRSGALALHAWPAARKERS